MASRAKSAHRRQRNKAQAETSSSAAAATAFRADVEDLAEVGNFSGQPTPSNDAMHRLMRAIITLVDRLTYTLVAHPRMARGFIASFFVVGIVGRLLVHPAHAQVLNSLETTVENATAGWMGNAIALAQQLFFVLMGTLLVYNMVNYYMAFETVRGMFSVILRSLLYLGVPYIVLQLAPTSVGAVINWALQVSGTVTGGTAPATTPDQIVQEGTRIGWGLFQATFNAVTQSHFVFDVRHIGSDLGYDFNQMVVDVLFLIVAGALCVIMIAAFTFIAVELVMAFLQAYFCLPLGAWTLGFMATPATSNIAMGWWRGLLQTAIRFIAVLAAASFAQNIGLQWETQLQTIVMNWNHLPQWDGQGAPPAIDIGAIKVIISMALGALALLYLVVNLPRIAEAILSGSPVMGGANAVQVAGSGAMMVGGAAAGGMLGGAVGAGKGAWTGWSQSFSGGSAVGLAGAARGAASGFAGAAGVGAKAGATAAARQARSVSNTIDRMRRG